MIPSAQSLKMERKQGSGWHPHGWCLAAGILSLVVIRFLPAPLVETYYSRGVYPEMRTILGGMVDGLRFPAIYLFLGLFLTGWGWSLRKAWRPEGRPRVRGARLVRITLAWLGGCILLFQLAWGINYRRVPLEHTIGIAPPPLDSATLRQVLNQRTEALVTLRSQIRPQDDRPIEKWPYSPDQVVDTVRASLREVLTALGYPAQAPVSVRLLRPEGILLHIGTAGFYLPYTGEGHVDAGLHALQLPFVMAHEMAHGYGFGDEGSCNFLAWLACLQNRDPWVRYAGQLSCWRYLAAAYREASPAGSEEFRRHLPDGIRADLSAVQVQMDRFPDIFPALRDAFYERYLQAQGIEEGLLSYDKLVWMSVAWQARRPLPD